jgi:hypothetical protein
VHIAHLDQLPGVISGNRLMLLPPLIATTMASLSLTRAFGYVAFSLVGVLISRRTPAIPHHPFEVNQRKWQKISLTLTWWGYGGLANCSPYYCIWRGPNHKNLYEKAWHGIINYLRSSWSEPPLAQNDFANMRLPEPKI